jgi:3-oxoacyl-[acyl-carrier-protein] synthase-3
MLLNAKKLYFCDIFAPINLHFYKFFNYMGKNIYTIITGTGSYLPTKVVPNSEFLKSEFYDSTGNRIDVPNEQILEKFKQITEIEERRYIEDEYMTSDLGFFAAEDAIKSSNTDKESFDYIIVAHNFGDIRYDNMKVDILPTLASRIKQKLGIRNPDTIAYDLPFGCPGWLQALIQADYYIKSGDAKRILVIGAETLSRISDPHDRDSMIYSDGAGAVIVEGIESNVPVGILTHKTRTDAIDHAWLLNMDKSFNPNIPKTELFLKMNGRKLSEYAITTHRVSYFYHHRSSYNMWYQENKLLCWIFLNHTCFHRGNQCHLSGSPYPPYIQVIHLQHIYHPCQQRHL